MDEEQHEDPMSSGSSAAMVPEVLQKFLGFMEKFLLWKQAINY